MDDLTGYPLRDALKIIEEDNHSIINIVKIEGTNKKFNNLTKAHVVRKHSGRDYVTLYVSYF